MKKNIKYLLGLTLFLLVGIASWSLYSLLNQGASDLLSKIGVENFYYQNLIVVTLIIVVLIFLGNTFKKSLKKIIR